MEKDFQKITHRAVDIKDQYEKNIEPKAWGVDQVFMGMIKDIGELSKILMVKGGYRIDSEKNVSEALGHQLSDVLFSILVIAQKTGVDLEESFWETMNEIEKKINK